MIKCKGGRFILVRLTRYRSCCEARQSEKLDSVIAPTYHRRVTLKLNIKGLLITTTRSKNGSYVKICSRDNSTTELFLLFRHVINTSSSPDGYMFDNYDPLLVPLIKIRTQSQYR